MIDANELRKEELTIIGESNTLIGEFHFAGIIRIHSKIQGILNFDSESTVTLERTSEVNGEINCHDIDIFGKVIGDIKASGVITIRPSAIIKGQISAQNMTIYPGANVNIEGHTLNDREQNPL